MLCTESLCDTYISCHNDTILTEVTDRWRNVYGKILDRTSVCFTESLKRKDHVDS